MDPATILALVTLGINAAKAAIDVGVDAAPFITALYDHITSKTTVTQADLTALEARIQALSDEFDVPLPDA